jgi:YgiT-type zinc finger domain-containing protein
MVQPAIHPTFPCRQCQAGIQRLRYITYFTWMGDELITVPNFPAWVCDVCGRREYDERAITWLITLLNPDAGKPSLPKRQVRATAQEPKPRRPAPKEPMP